MTSHCGPRAAAAPAQGRAGGGLASVAPRTAGCRCDCAGTRRWRVGARSRPGLRCVSPPDPLYARGKKANLRVLDDLDACGASAARREASDHSSQRVRRTRTRARGIRRRRRGHDPRGTPGLRIWALPTSPGTCELATENIRRANVPTPDAIDAPRRRNRAPRDAPPARKNV